MRKKPSLTPAVLPQRPKPPRGLPGHAAALWGSIVGDFPATHFRGANLALLETLCRCWARVQECDAAIAADGLFPDGRAHAAIKVQAQAWAEMRSCGTKLRLNINSTMRSEAAAARPNPKHALRKPWEA